VIDVATGIIIAQNRCTQEEAIELIKKASSNRNVKLRVVAQAIVESAGGGQVQTYFQ
jgi:AmiR/NasT family two-component response regulator